MKKLLILSLIASTLIFSSCNSDDDNDDGLSCSEATQNVNTALLNFNNAGSSDYTNLCNAYKSALEQQKTACGDSSGTIQSIIDGLGDCTESDTAEGN